MSRRSTTETIITALRILAEDIQSEDGVANAAIREAADRLEELKAAVKKPCVWLMAGDWYEIYETSCGTTWSSGGLKDGLKRGSPRENGANYCPRCGGRIKVKKCKT